MTDTIIAQATPNGNGALALIRLSGSDALTIAAKISNLSKNRSLVTAQNNSIHYGWVINNLNEPIDQVLFMVMRSPATFTGEDTVEITCHNNRFIISAIIEQALLHGARVATAGEFSKRAVLNNKIDVLQAEAINDLINAETSYALKKSLSQLKGTLSNWLYEFEKQLLKALVYCEASFEFLDEDVSFAPFIKEILEKMRADTLKNKKAFDRQQHLKQGARIALVGSVNSGKSSLFNALIGYKRAIVTPYAGTTRDTLEAGLIISNTAATYIDTAGIRETGDSIEQEGIKRSFEEAQKADCLLLVFDGSRKLSEQEIKIYENLYRLYSNKIISIQNKADLEKTYSFTPESLAVSTVTGQGLELLEKKIATKVAAVFAELDSPFMLNKRQYNLLTILEKKIDTLLELLSCQPQYEILSLHLRDTLESISELTGKSISENCMDSIFKEFCIGK
jgi:tRNA modification GTPase